MASSDTDDEDLRKAVALSLASQEAPVEPNRQNAMAATDVRPSTGTATTGIPGLNREAMEKERLTRLVLRKRDRSISPPPRSRKAPKLEEATVTLPSGARLNMFSTLVQQNQVSRKSDAANESTSRLRMQHTAVKDEHHDDVQRQPSVSDSAGLVYPHGVVKKTWAFGHERTGSDCKLEEILEPNTLRTAVMSAFQWDTDWVLAKLKVPPNGGSTRLIWIMQAKDESLRQQMRKETEGMRSFLRLCFPPMEGQVHCMHSKLMLLFHPHKLRVAIPSANLLNFDYGESGSMENSVFMVDLPRRLPNAARTEIADLTCFGQELMYFLEKQGLDQDVKDGMLEFDFSATSQMAFIHTVGGILFRDEAERTGLPGLGRAVRKLGLQTDDLEIDFAASSIGSLNDDQLRSIHSAAKGEDLIARAATALANTKADFFKASTNRAPSKKTSIRDKIRIYFPTRETVTASTAGAAGTICLSRKWYENMPFPRSCFRDYVSVRSGLLSHNKILYARGKRQSGNETAAKDVAWVYHGSANMSESAWGKLVYDKKEKAWKINCRNWECGVLLPVPAEKLEKVKLETPVNNEKVEGEDFETESDEEGPLTKNTSDAGELVGMQVFEGLVDLPFEYPGDEYNGREPWYFQERPR
ncbi:hypothetical protein LTR36_008374 [Oleoguttula mirabilis]|uniref:Phospholipase D/nuclease n=1 Tax=Oleoguttula mirabilis TaxID=1507867 RepID=A0AAV9J864_9PEZI|nr:hypothetical protein LTR36_008374 [Oleoguttula mirabilis]